MITVTWWHGNDEGKGARAAGRADRSRSTETSEVRKEREELQVDKVPHDTNLIH